MKEVIIKIFSFFTSTAILLLVLEVTFRLTPEVAPHMFSEGCLMPSGDPNLIYEFKPSVFGNNADGMADKEHNIAKPSSTIRIAVLGDSIAFGIGVERNERFSNLVEEKLNGYSGKNNSNIRYEVLNFSLPGYNTNNEIEQLKVKVAKYNPDIIILSYCRNDTDSVPHLLPLFLNTLKINNKPPAPFYSLWNFKLTRLLAQKSRFFRFIILRVYLIRPKDNNRQGRYQTVISGFKELKKYAVNNSSKVIILFNPVLDYDNSVLSEREAVTIEDLAQDNSFAFINMLDYYRHNFKAQEELWIKGSKNIFTGGQDKDHPNQLGHSCIADELTKKIIEISN